MKILELRFCNLNSLYGEWIIDFTAPEYESDGIFALTGPTGSGKTTLLDAICLALYGATPRLGKISKGGNEIMSRRTGTCYAEVMFESQAGRFRCHWEQRRSRKKPDGTLQNPEHQISDALTGRPIETKKSRVVKIIEEKTGLDFDRFTRSVLLAQGGFDTFLKADTEQKSKILEQITGTEMYSRISIRVHERQRDENEKLRLLEAEASGITLVDPEEEENLRRMMQDGQREEQKLSDTLNALEKTLLWMDSIDSLKVDISAFSDEEERLHTEHRAFESQRQRLDRSLAAVELEGAYGAIATLRTHLVEDQATLNAGQDGLPRLKAALEKQSRAWESAGKMAAAAREDQENSLPLIRQIRSLDQRLAEQNAMLSVSREDCEQEENAINRDTGLVSTREDTRAKVRRTLQELDTYLDTHAQDSWLLSGLTGLEQQLESLASLRHRIIRQEADRAETEKTLQDATESVKIFTGQRGIHRHRLDGVAERRRLENQNLDKTLEGRLLREYRAEKDGLLKEREYLARIAALEEHRAALEDGKPCPLCGSEHHPFAGQAVPNPDQTERTLESLTRRIDEAENLEAALRTLDAEHAAELQELSECEKREALAIHSHKEAQDRLTALTEDLTAMRSESEQLRQAAAAKLAPLGIDRSGLENADPSSLLTSLKERLETWQDRIREKARIEQETDLIDDELTRLNAVIETRRGTLDKKRLKLETLEAGYAGTLNERRQLYGGKDPDEEESRLAAALTGAEKISLEARGSYENAREALASEEAALSSLNGRIGRQSAECTALEDDFVSALKSAGFPDEQNFLSSRLPDDERRSLSAKAGKLENALRELKARKLDREERLAAEQAKKLTDRPRRDIEADCDSVRDRLELERQNVAGLKHKITANTEAEKHLKERHKAIENQKTEFLRWQTLHSLIGSSDGRKYRNFAQGLTFDLMISHANRQLNKMIDRYFMIRDESMPLELNVIDTYQAGEIRSTRNLSGGESFIVSLSLALGLSAMASRKVRVDSLFLDEGFGTLDEEALETALEVLSGLHQEGKLIGIISHITALKERIGTRIAVRPLSGGRSTLTGPGCRRASGEGANSSNSWKESDAD